MSTNPSAVVASTGGAFFAATGLTGATAASRYAGATTSGAPASGTFAVGDFVIDQSGIEWICVTAGSPGTWVNAAQSPELPWVPGDNLLLAANGDPMAFNNVILVTGGTLYLLRVNIRTAFTWTNVVVAVTSAGNNTGGSGGTFAGLYNSAGTLLSGSADVAGSLTSTGQKALALTSAQPMTPGTFVWVAVLCNLGTTQPTLQRSPANPTAINGALATGALRTCVNGTGLSALPSPSINTANNTPTNSQPIFVGAT